MKKNYNDALNYYENGEYKKALSVFLSLAEDKNPDACNKLAVMYCLGKGTRKNYKKAFNFANIGVNANMPESQVILGRLYQMGFGIKKDLNLAIKYFTLSAKQNNLDAMMILYDILKDRKEAIYWLNKGIEQSFIPCLFEAGKIHEANNNMKLAFETYNIILQDNDSKSLFYDLNYLRKFSMQLLGHYYMEGKFVEKDVQKGLKYYYQLANDETYSNRKRVQALLYMIYFNGFYGVPKDINKGFYWLKKSLGSKDALIGTLYLNGQGTEKNEKKAFEIFSEGSANNDVRCKIELSEMYINGIYVEKNNKKAFEILDDLVKNHSNDYFVINQPRIYYNYARFWQSGDCTYNKPNKYKAKEYFEKAYNLGYKECKYALDGINIELRLNEKDNELNNFAKQLIIENIDNASIYNAVTKKIKSCFEKYYTDISQEIKTYLSGGLLNYIFYYSCGENFYTKFDFSNVVLSLSKALENILHKVFFEGYVNFLKMSDIPAENFAYAKSRFVKQERRNGETVYSYIDIAENSGSFTLGSLYYLLDARRIISPFNSQEEFEINEYMLKYLDSIFIKTDTTSQERKIYLTNTILSLSKKISEIALQVRNPSAHRSITPHWVAENLANHLLLKDNLILEILSLLTPTARRKLKV